MNRINLSGFNGMLEIGCGNEEHKRNGYLGMDIADHGQNIVWDAEKGIPLPDNSCTHIYSSHCFEHLHKDKIIDVMNECWRVLEDDGELWIVVPHMKSEKAWIPTHIMYWNETTFRFFTGETNPDYANIDKGHNAKIKIWTIRELVTNERPDIHCKLTPYDKKI